MPAFYKKNDVYGLSQGVLGIIPEPIVSRRNPTAADKAPLGTPWINRLTNAYFVLTSIVGNSATWATGATAAVNFATTGTLGAGTSLTVGTTATIGTGLTVTAGGIAVGAGGATISGLTDVTGAIQASTTITAGTGITATTGNIVATAGNLRSVLGDIIATLGNITATEGDVIITHDTNGLVLGAAGELNSNGADTEYTCAATGSFSVTLGDAAGADALNIYDSAPTLVSSIDSNGTATFVDIALAGPVRIMTGAGAPANGLAVNVGDMYIRTDAAAAAERIYIASAANTWTNVTCAA